MKKAKLAILSGLIIGLLILAWVVLNYVPFNKKIEITNEYIINDHWDDKYNNAIRIQKMVVTDSLLNIYSKKFIDNSTFWNFENSLKPDKSFIGAYWGLNSIEPKRPKLKDTVYFEKYNGWEWKLNGKDQKILGKLENNSWYKFSNLLMNTQYFKYLYVDSIGTTHVFSVNKANY